MKPENIKIYEDESELITYKWLKHSTIDDEDAAREFKNLLNRIINDLKQENN